MFQRHAHDWQTVADASSVAKSFAARRGKEWDEPILVPYERDFRPLGFFDFDLPEAFCVI
jgi:hypothetical protein